jgi:hypothetical protein
MWRDQRNAVSDEYARTVKTRDGTAGVHVTEYWGTPANLGTAAGLIGSASGSGQVSRLRHAANTFASRINRGTTRRCQPQSLRGNGETRITSDPASEQSVFSRLQTSSYC